MRRRFRWIWLLPAVASASDSPRIKVDLKEPAGMIYAEGKLYVADRSQGLIAVRPRGAKEFYQFAKSEEFRKPSGLSYGRGLLYLADPAAGAIFEVDPAGNATRVKAESLKTPSEVVFWEGSRTSTGRVLRPDELVVLEHNQPFRLPLGKEAAPQPWGEAMGASSLSLGSVGLLHVDRSRDLVIESLPTGSNWNVKLFSQVSPPKGTVIATYDFPAVKQIKQVIFHRGIYYLAAKEGVFAMAGRQGTRLIPITYSAQPVQAPEAILATDEELIIRDAGNRLISWPLLVPVTVSAETDADPAGAIAAFLRYLDRNQTLVTRTVTLPIRSESVEQGCYKIACIPAELDLLNSPAFPKALYDVLCDRNRALCEESFRKLGPGQELIVPVAPREKYFFVSSRSLDGKQPVRELIRLSIGASEKEDPTLWKRAIELLERHNPKQSVDELLTLEKEGQTVNLPVVRHRYYVAVPRSELLDEKSALGELRKRTPALDVQSFETSESKTAASPISTAPPSGKALEPDYKSILSQMKLPEKWGDGGNANVLVIEQSSPSCRHPVFHHPDLGSTFSGLPEECKGLEELDGRVTEAMNAADHSTCVASLIGARRLPYGKPLAPKGTLRVATSKGEIKEQIAELHTEYRTAIVNFSQVDGDQKSWEELLRLPAAKHMLFVAAAGNTGESLRPESLAFPAFLAPQYPNLISVGALASSGGGRWSRGEGKGSNWGNSVEIMAPGESIPCAAGVDGMQAVYGKDDGTSMATALVSAVAALLLDKGLTPAEIKGRLLATAIPDVNYVLGLPAVHAGRLSTDRALLDITRVHLEEGDRHSSGKIENTEDSESAVIGFRAKPGGNWTEIRIPDIKNIRAIPDSSNGKKLYRLAYFDRGATPPRIAILEKVELRGCFVYIRDSDKIHRRVRFSESHCPAASAEEVNGMTDFIGYARNIEVEDQFQ